MRRLLVLCWTAFAVAACGSGDEVGEGGDCSGGKKCESGLICEPVSQTCVRNIVVDARPVDARPIDARPVDAGADAGGADARPDGGGVAPDTTITSGPTGTINVNTATFTFTCTTPPCTFECSTDTGAFAACTTPATLNNLAPGAHTFRVRASAGGQTDSTPATANFTVNLAGLATVITESPENPTNQVNATFRFECRQDGVAVTDCTFSCTLDGTSAACTAPQTYSNLAVATHTFSVTGTRLGVAATPATFMWTIDTTPPTVTITSGPSGGAVSGPNPTFTYAPSETAETTSCTLDGAAVACGATSQAFTGLAAGPHTFTVTVTDAAGNPSSPASAAFTVDNAGPVVTVTSPTGTSGPSGTLVFTVEDESPPVTSTCDFGQGAGPQPCEPAGFNYNALPGGQATVVIVSTDAVGNVTTTTHNFTVVVMGPVVQIFAPIEGTAVCSSGQTLLFDTVPNTATVTYSCTNNGSVFPCNEGGTSLNGVLQAGLNVIVVSATDNLNLTGTATVQVFVDNTRPQILIITPGADEIVCPAGTITYSVQDTGVRGPITISECTITGPEGQTRTCVAQNGVIVYEGLPDGFHTVSLRATDTCGNETQPAVQRRFDVDAIGPTINDLVATPGAVNTGTATATFTRENDQGDPEVGGAVQAGLAFVPELAEDATANEFLESCVCDLTSCSCSQLAAGQNRLGVRGTDECGNIGPFATTFVGAAFGPYAGHKVAIAHSYADTETDPPPGEIVGNSVALPYAVRDAGTSRAPRVLAFRSPDVSAAAVARVQAAIAAEVADEGATWSATDPVLYSEFSNPDDLPLILPGRDVLLVYDDVEVDFSFIGFDWNDSEGGALPPFLDAGGVAVALANGHFALYPQSQVGAKPRPQLAETTVVKYYSADLFGDDYYIAQDAPDLYLPADGLECTQDVFSALGQPGSPVFERVNVTFPEGVFYSSCPAVTDNVFPYYEIVVGEPTRGLGEASCVGAIVGPSFLGHQGGVFTVQIPGPQAAPTGTFTCQTGPQGGFGSFNDPSVKFPCVVEGNTFTGTTFEQGWRVDIHLVEPDNVDVARGGTATVTIDNQFTFFGPSSDFDNQCIDRYTVFEPAPVNCFGATTERVWRSVTCTLFRDPDGSDAEPEVLVETRTGAGCGATPAENPADGFISQQAIASDWTSVVEGFGSGVFRVVYVVEDWRGNSASGQRTFGSVCPIPQKR